MRVELSQRELTVICAALCAVTPIGGGSEPFNLSRRLLPLTDSTDPDLVATYCRTVIGDAIEAGVLSVDAYT